MKIETGDIVIEHHVYFILEAKNDEHNKRHFSKLTIFYADLKWLKTFEGCDFYAPNGRVF